MDSKRAITVKKKASERHVQFQDASRSTSGARHHRTGAEVASSSTSGARQHRSGAEVATIITPGARQHRSGVEVTSSTSRAVQRRAGLDYFQADAQFSDGTKILAQLKINKPTGARAYFHMLLDASGSMFHLHAGLNGGRKRHVYEHLFECYEDLVTSGEALRQNDIVWVWMFNKRAKLLCEVEVRDFHKKKDQIKKDYEKELGNRSETRLFDAVAHVMDEKIHAVWNENKKADFFLVAFTDGRDRGTGTTSLDAMMDKLMELNGRLHTFFITVNLPTNAPLYTRLAGQREMKLVHCESTQPSDISCAFNTVRKHIKAVLVVMEKRPGDPAPNFKRMVESGETEEAIWDQMMNTWSKQMDNTSLIELYNRFTKPGRLTN